MGGAVSMSLMSPIVDTGRGIKTYLAGARWLKNHPRYLFLVFFPMIIGLVLLSVGSGFFLKYADGIFDWVLFARPESWWGIPLYYAAKALLYLAFMVLGMVACILLTNVIASPVYEYVSMAVEADITGKTVPELSLRESFRLIGEELKKVLFILGISILLLLIPGLNVLSMAVTAFLVGWDFFDYPLARRGWDFRERFSFVVSEFWVVLGFGLWLVIPFVQFIFMPLAVAGGTMLSVEALQKRSR
jgi:uncharacterized protein involved in cysteine biosynthesis